jgi:hypothetical protein
VTTPTFFLRISQATLLLVLSVAATIMSTSGLKAIAPVPTAADFLDIVLSKTQRKTPTVCPAVFLHGAQVTMILFRLSTRISK